MAGQYLTTIENAFDNVRRSNLSELNSSISEIVQLLMRIEGGSFVERVTRLGYIDNMDDWLQKNRNDGFFDFGLNFPENIDEKLAIMMQLFIYLSKGGDISKFITSYYTSSSSGLLDLGMTLVAYLNFTQKSILDNVERLQKEEHNAVLRFHKGITDKFKVLLISKLASEYSDLDNKIIMGDYFNIKGDNVTVISRSNLYNALNKYSTNVEIKKALELLRDFLEKSNDTEAIEAFNDMNAELTKSKPAKKEVESFWAKIVGRLPDIKNVVDITAGLSKLFLLFA